MEDAHQDPHAFAKLKKDDMKAQLARVGLPVGGNKPNLLDRYRNWWNAQSGQITAFPAAANPANEAYESIAATVNDSDTSKNVRTGPFLERLLVPAEQKLSRVTLHCLDLLCYTPGAQFRMKRPEKDLSNILQPLQIFVETLLRGVKQNATSSELGENETTLGMFLAETMPDIRATPELTPFFASWGIDIRSEETALTTQDHELNAQSPASYNTEEGRKLVLKELDIISSAIQHRLLRWAMTFPKRSANDMLWPTTFSAAERKDIRAYMLAYAQEHDLLDPELSVEAQTKAVADMRQADDFPVAMAKTTSVIQAALLETRFGESRRSRSQSQATQALSRSASPVERIGTLNGEENGEEDGEEEEHVVVIHSKKRKSRSVVGDKNSAETHGDVYKDYEGQDPKRNRRRKSLVNKIAQDLCDGERI